MEAAWRQNNVRWEGTPEMNRGEGATGRIRRVDRFHTGCEAVPGRDMAFASRTASQAGVYGQTGFTPSRPQQAFRPEPHWPAQAEAVQRSRMPLQQDIRQKVHSAVQRVMARVPQTAARLKQHLARPQSAARSGQSRGIGKPAVLLTCLAVPLLGLGLMGMIGAGELNRQLQQMGMGYLNIDEAISSMRSLAGFTGRSMDAYFTGANAFLLFTVTQRIPLLLAGAGSLVSGIVSAVVHRGKAAVPADEQSVENGRNSANGPAPHPDVYRR